MWTATKTVIVDALAAAGTTASIEGSYSDKKLSKPMVVIDPLKDGEDAYPFGGEQGEKKLAMVVTIFASSPLAMDTIKDILVSAFKKDSIVGAQYDSYDSDYDFNYDTKNPVHAKTLVVNYIK